VHLVRTVPVFVQNNENTHASCHYGLYLMHACPHGLEADAIISIFIICKVCTEEKEKVIQ
jgi:hypothetical protein